jgi:hypothetical protein
MAIDENDLVVGPLTPAAGVTTISLDFYFENDGWLEVYKSGSETALVIDTDYTLTGEGTVTGVLTLIVAADGVDAYSVYLVVPLARSSDMQLRGEFKSGPFNTEMDRLWQAVQGLRTTLSQTFRTGRTSTAVAALFSESIAARAGRVLRFDDDGSGLLVGPTVTTIDGAVVSAAAAADSATAAGTSETNAGNSATAAASSATAAGTSETNAGNSATAAASSATAAGTSETNAGNSETAAASSATAAGTSETNAGNSATAAASSATAAASSATAAGTSETNAGNSATAAASSATAAGTSETNAGNSATAAASSATAAGTSETNAGNSETAAASSATAAGTSETNAGNSATAAASSATAAGTSETNAGNSETAAASSATAAGTSETNAGNSATAAASSAAALTGLDLAAIAESKGITATAGFVYITALDTDGGAWATDFPKIMVITAEATSVKIYDATDTTLPLHTTLDFTGYTITSVDAVEGVLSVGTTTGLAVFNLADGDTTVALDYTTATTPAIVNNAVIDVAMHVYPDAPIDPATGLQIPTIAVGTDGGLSVINNDGTVYDGTPSGHAWWAVAFRDDGAIVGTRFANGRAYITTIYNERFTADRTDYDEQYNFSGDGSTNDGHYIGGIPETPNNVRVGNDGVSFRTLAHGLFRFAPNPSNPANWMNAQITSTFNTGWMVGDIKGAFLSSVSTVSLVGSGELVTNGTFDSDTTGWEAQNANVSLASVGGQLEVTNNGAGWAYQSVATVVGKSYTLAFNYITRAGAGQFRAGTSVSSSAYALSVTTGAQTVNFVAATTTTFISLSDNAGGSGVVNTIDNVSVKLADEDRSVNAKGLIVNGTIARAAVATGAELVGYGPTTVDNYLEQPYNADLDFGTGDFSLIVWGNGGWTYDKIFSRGDGSNAGTELIFYQDNPAGVLRLKIGASFITTPDHGLPYDVWKMYTVVRRSGVVYFYVNGTLLHSASGGANITQSGATTRIGIASNTVTHSSDANGWNGTLSGLRISATAPTAAQIAKMYNDEKDLFRDNALAVLSADAVTALAHDPVSELLYVGGASGMATISGITPISRDATAVSTFISVVDGMEIKQ